MRIINNNKDTHWNKFFYDYCVKKILLPDKIIFYLVIINANYIVINI